MNFDLVQLVVAASGAWFGVGLIGGALAFALAQKGEPAQAGDNYSRHLGGFWLATIGGPLGLAAMGIIFLWYKPEYHGLLFPGRFSWSSIDAEALQRRAIWGGDTTVE